MATSLKPDDVVYVALIIYNERYIYDDYNDDTLRGFFMVRNDWAEMKYADYQKISVHGPNREMFGEDNGSNCSSFVHLYHGTKTY